MFTCRLSHSPILYRNTFCEIPTFHRPITQKIDKKKNGKGKSRKEISKPGTKSDLQRQQQQQQQQQQSISGGKPFLGLSDSEKLFEPVQVASIADIKDLNDFRNQWIEMDRNFVKHLYSLSSTEHLQNYQLGYLNQNLHTVHSLVSV
jgi:hypothetical protein